MASPHPEDELARVKKLCSTGLPPAVLVTGANDFFRNEAVEMLLSAVPQDAELRRVDAADDRGGSSDEGDDADGEDRENTAAEGLAEVPELLELRGGGLFARRAFLCVRRGAKWWQRCAPVVAAQLPKFGKGCGLLLEAHKLDKRRKVAAGLVKDLAAAGAVFEFRDLYDQPFDRSRSPAEGELAKWVVRRAANLGVPLTAEAAWLVVAQVGKSLGDLVAELGRLRDRLGGAARPKALGPEDLRGRLTCSFESTPFELAEAVLGHDRARAFRSVRAMFDRGVRGKDGKRDSGGVFPFATSWLYQSLAKAHEGRQWLEGGVTARDLPGKVGVFQFADRFVEQVQKNPLARLRRGLLALHHCQRCSRTTGEDPDVLLERFLGQWFDGRPIPAAEEMDL